MKHKTMKQMMSYQAKKSQMLGKEIDDNVKQRIQQRLLEIQQHKDRKIIPAAQSGGANNEGVQK
jgi:hypothetical protein